MRPEAVGSTRWFGKCRLLMPVLCKRQNPEQDHVRLKCSAGMNSFGQDEQDRQDAEEETGSGPSCESCPSCPKSPDDMSWTKSELTPNSELSAGGDEMREPPEFAPHRWGKFLTPPQVGDAPHPSQIRKSAIGPAGFGSRQDIGQQVEDLLLLQHIEHSGGHVRNLGTRALDDGGQRHGLQGVDP